MRRWNRPLWGVMVLIVGCMAAIRVKLIAHPPGGETGSPSDFHAARSKMGDFLQRLPRPLNIFPANRKRPATAEHGNVALSGHDADRGKAAHGEVGVGCPELWEIQ
jgi:hypothetical protein